MKAHALLLTLLCLGHAAHAGEVTETPHRHTDAPLSHYAVPALETMSLNLGLLAFSNLLTRESFSLITWDTARSHVDGRAGWEFDVDYFVTNQIGHPYQGALPFMMARSSGVPFWVSCLYPFFSSLTWEYLYERDRPSINDQINTTLGGILMGEAVYRAFRIIVDDQNFRHRWLQNIAAILLSPPAAFNRWLFDGNVEPPDLDENPPFFASAIPGVSDTTRVFNREGNQVSLLELDRVQPSFTGELEYGQPGDPEWRYRHPFSYFNARAGASFWGKGTASLFIRGLLAGKQYNADDGQVRGVFGVYGLYDYGANSLFQVGSVGVGFGTTLQVRWGARNFLKATGILGGIGLGAAGELGLNPRITRNYHLGPGAEAIFEAALVRRGLGQFRLRANQWIVAGGYVEPIHGRELITYLNAEIQVRIAPQIAVGVETPLALRLSRFDGGPNSALVSEAIRINLVLMSNDSFGTAGR